MEINVSKLGQQQVDNTASTQKMKLSENATTMVFQLFTKNVYSNPIGTVVREITSNCFDSHEEAKVKAPVIIKLSDDEETQSKYISFIDFGVGMSPERMFNIYGVYFESTKRADNTQIGGFGIGAKSVLAYKRSTGLGEGEYDNSFYVITTYNGIKYTYCIYEGEDAPIISKLHEEKTKERNGTEIRIPVLDKDIRSFTNEMVRQLYYFENIVFEGFEETDAFIYGSLTNDYQIVNGKSFLFRGGNYSNYIHICLGRVAYPIDYNALGLSDYDYKLPVALKLNVGDINVTVSRESIDYNETTIKMLKKKLEVVKSEITDLLVKQYDNIKSLTDYFKVKNNYGTLHFANGATLYAGELIKMKDVVFSSFAYNSLKMPNDKQLFRLFFDSKTYGKPVPKRRYSSDDSSFTGGYKALSEKDNLYYVDGDFKRVIVKQAYLKDIHTRYHIIKLKELTVADEYDIKDMFGEEIGDVFNKNTGKPTKFGKQLLKMQKEYMGIVRANTVNYDTFEVPQDFIDSRKRKRNSISEEMRKATISLKFIIGTHYYTNRDRVKVSDLLKYKGTIFYGTQDDSYALSEAAQTFRNLFSDNIVSYHTIYKKIGFDTGKKNNETIMFIQLSKTNVKYMPFCKKAIHVKYFKERMGYRKADDIRNALTISTLKNRWEELNQLYTNTGFSNISEGWGNTIATVKDYFANANNPILDKVRYIDPMTKRLCGVEGDVPLSEEQKGIMKHIEDLLLLQEVNRGVMRYINLPYSISSASDDFYELMKKVLSL